MPGVGYGDPCGSHPVWDNSVVHLYLYTHTDMCTLMHMLHRRAVEIRVSTGQAVHLKNKQVIRMKKVNTAQNAEVSFIPQRPRQNASKF